ncbi:hypothetical protein GCM10009864_13830 [Streptomyces lunalinharesii]|uniref:Uncharacterized protein n=1 Tax=Streptomyces lunalinharesii TaxID=333384 RepID=A0ABN3RF20_9ACTN
MWAGRADPPLDIRWSSPARRARCGGAPSGHPGLRPDVLDRLVAPWCTERGQPAFYRQIAQNDQRFTDEVAGRYGESAMPVLIC